MVAKLCLLILLVPICIRCEIYYQDVTVNDISIDFNNNEDLVRKYREISIDNIDSDEQDNLNRRSSLFDSPKCPVCYKRQGPLCVKIVC